MTEKEKKTLREAIIIIQGLLDSGQLDLFGEKKSRILLRKGLHGLEG